MTWWIDAKVGAAVGVTDVALVYPLAVLATRREAGMPMRTALAQGRLWAGGWTAGTLLIPYSIGVETLSNGVRRTTTRMLGMEEDSMTCQVAAAAATSGVITFFGLQPIEKKMVGCCAGESSGDDERFSHVFCYTKTHGLRALYGGVTPLFLREFVYVFAITVANPQVTKLVEREIHAFKMERHASIFGGFGAFLIGTSAGLVTAPFQTLNALMKSEANRGQRMLHVLQEMFQRGALPGINRLWYGAATRSMRTGGAGVLYYS
ncbi:hypothetical protein GUITHDRAFT_120692 [Guillardia theta CCMP2712]|uniref:Mitochondrial carrier protein n=1 Tax=Guillardia theta (strain CCMP2712) TaxID=905079 RepID=L1IBA4_GUITC|nr:hypothetical protein GUITHDRAFT_120692 [Guillardia theta CCMP2712]EKX33125.1 hypothetical protein GUITHDRAFT_120692 [Guillardia theta CCMP2712]|eukprot:XP_005820105.1 hypothetical protein GUITHDRAFT_120692 [Guillardia theta CCMP2712]